MDYPHITKHLTEFYINTKPRAEHVNTIRIQGDMNNNKMERLNGEVRDREKVMRGLKRKDTPILSGYQLYHNYIRVNQKTDNLSWNICRHYCDF
jgi:putative transposase